MKTERIATRLDHGAALLRAGELVAVPTETVYGLAGNGLDAAVVEQIYEVKGRPAVKPLSLMVHDAGALSRYCRDVPQAAYTLAEKFWPGPLTIVLPAADCVPEVVRAGGGTVGLRCPDHPATLALLELAGVPLAAPSANPSGAPSPKTAQAVLDYFDGKIAAVVDGGACGLGRESTIVDLSQTPYRVLRPGVLPEEAVWDALAQGLRIVGVTGGTGCGKTTLLRECEDMGALVIDCDAVYHELLAHDEAMIAEIAARFPDVVEQGAVQRKKLGAAVFSDAAALEELNAITHRHVIRELNRRLRDWARQGGTRAAIDAIALIESGVGAQCGVVVGVTAPREARVQRLMAREAISREYAEARIDAQKPNEWFAEHCDKMLENSGTIEEFRKKCEDMLQEVYA